jgi:hypothetical protein
MTSDKHNSTSQGKTRGIFLMVVAVIAALAVLGFLLSRMDGKIAIVTNASTPTNTEVSMTTTITSITPTEATITPSTLSPEAEQARAIAEPILQAVANRMPEVEDDFSFDTSNWSVGFSGQNSAQIADGMLRLTVADAASDTWMGSRHVAMSADDFVVQFDVRVAVMEFDSHLSILWRYLPNDNEAYRLRLFPNLDGAWAVDNVETQIDAGNSGAVTLNEWFTVTLIGRDNRFAVLLDGQALSYFEDSQRPIGRVVLGMNIFSGDAIAEFDNVKYWNLANVSGLP